GSEGYYACRMGRGPKDPHRFGRRRSPLALFTGWQKRTTPLATPQPGAGIGLRCGGGIVALDYDDEEAALRVSEAMGDSHVNKAGRTGGTAFFRADFPVNS